LLLQNARSFMYLTVPFNCCRSRRTRNTQTAFATIRFKHFANVSCI